MSRAGFVCRCSTPCFVQIDFDSLIGGMAEVAEKLQWMRFLSILTLYLHFQIYNIAFSKAKQKTQKLFEEETFRVSRSYSLNYSFQEISNRTHVSGTPKPECLIARSQLTERGPLGFGPIQLLMDYK